MYELKFSLETLSPIVITAMSNSTVMTKSHDEISGSIIRGILAARYVTEKKLGDSAYKDAAFRKIFYGGLKFITATPAVSDKRSFILPLSLQRGKKGTDDNNFAKDLFIENPIGYKTFRGYGIVDGDKIFCASVKKNIFMHMSRSEAVERISGKSEEGHIYNYEAVDEGQKFYGSIIGNADDLKKLDDALKLQGKNFVTYIGKSRFTQYGKCRLTFYTTKQIDTPKFSDKIYLRLDSALVPTEDYFIDAKKILTAEVADVLNKDCGREIFSIGKVFSSGIEIENFVVTWGMKRPRVQALAAGTVFEIKAEKLTPADLKILADKLYCGFGTRTEEGFGQMRIWQPKIFTVDKPEKIKLDKQKTFSNFTKDIAKNILLGKYLEQLRIFANEDAAALTPQLQRGNFTHFFSRLHEILSNVGKTNVRKNFGEKITAESKNGTLFQDNLKKIYVGTQKLYDVLTGNDLLPYEGKNFLNDDNKKVFSLIGFNESDYKDRFCLEYLQNFLRAARKIAALKGGDDND